MARKKRSQVPGEQDRREVAGRIPRATIITRSASDRSWKATFIREIGQPATAEVEVDGYVYKKGVSTPVNGAQKRRLEQLTQFQFTFEEV